jgi:uncharacterized membrane protein
MERFKKLVAVYLAGLMITAVAITGCGRTTKVENTTSTQTLGQEMIDLKKAFDEGAITEKEYNNAKKSLMKNSK